MTLFQSNYALPFRDASGFCNVLMSAIGGDGANMAAKILFKVCVKTLGLDGAYDGKYRGEKKGTPTTEKFDDILKEIQQETDRRWVGRKELAANPIL